MHQQIYEKLKSVAINVETAYYNEVAPLANLDMSKPDHRTKLGKILCEISEYEHEQKRPMLSAVVILKDKNMPGKGFFDLARELGKYKDKDDFRFFLKELVKVHDYWREQKKTKN